MFIYIWKLAVLYTDCKEYTKLDERAYVKFSCDGNSISIEGSDLGA